MKRYGYIRVSSKNQNPERQLLALRDCKIEEKDIFMEWMQTKHVEVGAVTLSN